MNRYLRDGVIADLLAGRSVTIVVPTYRDGRNSFLIVEHHLPRRKVRDVSSVQGHERITLRNGAILRFAAAGRTAPRIPPADVYVLQHSEGIDHDTAADVLHRATLTGADVIRT